MTSRQTYWKAEAQAEHLRGKKAGFTLIELLAVIVITVMLLAIVVPAVSKTMEGSDLTRSGQLVCDQINLARQMAFATNSAVEVRLIKVSNLSSSGYNAVQLWTNNRAGVLSPVNAVSTLVRGTVISDSVTLSEACSGGLTQGTLPLNPGKPESGAPYVSFQVKPNGMVLPAIDLNHFYFTVISGRMASRSVAKLPPNYVTIQVNPVTATPLVYRP